MNFCDIITSWRSSVIVKDLNVGNIIIWWNYRILPYVVVVELEIFLVVVGVVEGLDILKESQEESKLPRDLVPVSSRPFVSQRQVKLTNPKWRDQKVPSLFL